MNFKKIIVYFYLYLLPLLAFANNNSSQYVSEFVGGLNISQIKSCETKYKKACPIVNAKTAVEWISEEWSCVEKKMAMDKICIQASKIRQLTSYPATELRKSKHVSIFTITTLADAQTIFYIVDAKGKLMHLSDDLDLSVDKNYLSLKKRYPNIALTNFIYFDLYPKSRMLSNKHQQLIFRQELRDGACVGCSTIGIADIAYEFDQYGVYVHRKLHKITAQSINTSTIKA